MSFASVPQGLKPLCSVNIFGTAEAVPLSKTNGDVALMTSGATR